MTSNRSGIQNHTSSFFPHPRHPKHQTYSTTPLFTPTLYSIASCLVPRRHPPTGSTSTRSLRPPTIALKPCHRRQRCSRSIAAPIPPIWTPFSPNNVFLLSSRMARQSANQTYQSLRRHRAPNVERHPLPIPPHVVQLSALYSVSVLYSVRLGSDERMDYLHHKYRIVNGYHFH